MGPFVSNVTDVIEGMREVEAITIVNSMTEVEALLDRFVDEFESLELEGKRAQSVWQSYSGVSDRITSRIAEVYNG